MTHQNLFSSVTFITHYELVKGKIREIRRCWGGSNPGPGGQESSQWRLERSRDLKAEWPKQRVGQSMPDRATVCAEEVF